MSKTKRVSYAGIPVKERARVNTILGGMMPDKRTPQEVWESLNNYWAEQREEAQAKKDKQENDRAEGVRECAIEALVPALKRLFACRNFADAIENEADTDYLSHQEMAAFIKLGLDEAGEKLEQSLCNLGLVEETDAGLFVYGLTSEGIKKGPETEEEEATQ